MTHEEGNGADQNVSDGHDKSDEQPEDSGAENVELFTRQITVRSGSIPRPVVFCVGIGSYDQDHIINTIRKHGGEVRKSESMTTRSNIIHLTDAHAKQPPDATTPAYKWTYVTDCVEQNTLLDLEPYKIPQRNPVGRPKGGSLRARARKQSDGGEISNAPKEPTNCREPEDGNTTPQKDLPAQRSPVPNPCGEDMDKSPSARSSGQLNDHPKRPTRRCRHVCARKNVSTKNLKDDSHQDGRGKDAIDNDQEETDSNNIAAEVKEEPVVENCEALRPDKGGSGATASDNGSGNAELSGDDCHPEDGTVPLQNPGVGASPQKKGGLNHSREPGNKTQKRRASTRNVPCDGDDAGDVVTNNARTAQGEYRRSWTAKQDKQVMALGGYIRAWRKDRQGEARWMDGWKRLAKQDLLPSGKNWRDCMRRYMFLFALMNPAAPQRVQLTSGHDGDSEQSGDVPVGERNEDGPHAESTRSRRGLQNSLKNSPSNKRAVSRGVKRNGRQNKADKALPRMFTSTESDDALDNDGERKTRPRKRTKRVLESHVAADQSRQNTSERKARKGRDSSRGLQKQVETKSKAKVPRESRTAEGNGWEKLFSLVPDVPPERARTVVHAVRAVSLRARISQEKAFQEILHYRGDFNALMKVIEDSKLS